MNREQKSAVVDEIAGQIETAEAIFAVDYRGLSVPDAAELRGRLRDAGTRFRIVKNSLTERAAEKAGAEALKELLEGPTALALVQGDAAVAAKALNDAARQTGILEFKGGLMNGASLSADDIRSIARLPAREVLNAQLVGTIAAPVGGLVRGLNALIAGIAIQLQAIADQGLVGGAESEAAPAEQTEAEAPAEAAEQAPAAEEALAEEAPVEVAEEPAQESEASEPEASGDEAPSEPEQAEQTETEAEAAPDADPSDA